MPRPLRVFLCHASQDKLAVYELYQRLKTEDWIDPWLDKVSILPGKNWRSVIEKAVEDSDAAVICLSNQAVSKEGFVQREFRYAYDIALEKPDGTIYLIPLRLDDCSVPRGLRSFQYVNYFGADQEDAYFDLLRSLRERHEQVIRQEEDELERNRIEEETKSEVEKAIRQRAIEQAIRQQEETEKIKKEIAERKIRGKQAREIEKKTKNDARKKRQQEFVDQIFNFFLSNSRRFGIGGIIFIGLLCAIVGGNYFFQNFSAVPTKSPTATSTPRNFAPILELGSTIFGQDDMILVYIPSGKFVMGGSESDEKPIHGVYLGSFWIDKTEVTNAMYARCVADGKCDPPSTTDHFNDTIYANHPVVYVNWNQASDYCSWADRRLPTEAEWEKAARGTGASIYPWGSDAPNKDLLNYNSNVGDTTEVGKYPDGASVYGALDMAGNVWEWVHDWYNSNYYARAPESNPLGPNLIEGVRVLRGGSWNYSDLYVRSAIRLSANPSYTANNFGFRCALSL